MLPVFQFCAQKGKVMAQQKRILVIDDERKMIESMQKLLSNEGYEVDIADGAQEGMALFETGSFDLVITDMMMPDYDGLYVMDTVRKHSADTPVIVVTGYGSMDSVIEAMRKGAYDYVIKPFDFDRIKATVQKVFDKQREQEEILKQKRLNAARIQKITKKLAELIEPIVVEYQAGIQMIDVERSRASKE
jgi:DNA-binding NtrC family response regulator